MADGVDVSNYQGDIDWAAARRGGLNWAYVKLTEGIGYIDPAADAHINAARAAGVLVGAYHFARPDTGNTPEQDGTDFAHALQARGMAQAGVLPPCLDMEKTGPFTLSDWAARFTAVVRDITGYEPAMTYASSSFWTDHLSSGDWITGQQWGWIAHYGRPPGEPLFKPSWAVMHQYADNGTIAGYAAPLDVDTCWVDLATLTSGTGTTPPPPPPPHNAPPWPLGPGQYFGLVTGPAASHGGYYASERPYIKQLQEALQHKGFAPVYAGWADGVYEEPTRQSVLAFQRSVGYIQTGNIWPDDWAKLLG